MKRQVEPFITDTAKVLSSTILWRPSAFKRHLSCTRLQPAVVKDCWKHTVPTRALQKRTRLITSVRLSSQRLDPWYRRDANVKRQFFSRLLRACQRSSLMTRFSSPPGNLLSDHRAFPRSSAASLRHRCQPPCKIFARSTIGYRRN